MLKHLNRNKITPNRVLIFGGTGFIGESITNLLKKSIDEVLIFGSKDFDLTEPNCHKQISKNINENDKIIFISAKAPCRDMDDYLLNMQMLKSLLYSTADKKIDHLIYISSDAVYSDTKNKINENSLTEPNSFHGTMHLSRELILKNCFPEKLVIVRPTLVYGLNDPHNGYGPNKFRRQVFDNEDIQLFGEGEELRDHIHVEDISKLVQLLLFNKSIGTINAVSGQTVSFKELALFTVSRFKNKILINSNPRKGEMPHLGLRQFDTKLLLENFPELKITSWQDGLSKVIKDFLGKN